MTFFCGDHHNGMLWTLLLMVMVALLLTVGAVSYTSMAVVNSQGRRKNIQIAATLGGLLLITLALSWFLSGTGRAQDLTVNNFRRDAFLPRGLRGDRQALDTLLSL